MSASMLTLRCALSLRLPGCGARAGDFPCVMRRRRRAALPFFCFVFKKGEANGREPGLVMYCVSVKLHREGLLLWSGFFFKLTCGFHWVGLAWQPIPLGD